MKKSSVMTYAKILAIVMAVFYSTEIYSQSSLIGTLPMQFNPAFAGGAGCPRIGTISQVVIYKSPFSNFGTYNYNRQNYEFSYDNFIPKISSGIGIHGGYSRLAYNGWQTNTLDLTHDIFLGLSIAPKFSFKGKYTLSPAAEINANFKNTNYDHFSQKMEPIKSSINPELRLGLAFNARKFYAGVSYHINGGFGNEIGGRTYGTNDFYRYSISPRWYLQMGYNFQRREDSKFSFSPQIVYGRYQTQSNIGQTNYDLIVTYMLINLNFRYKQFIWGLAHGGFDGLQIMVGWQKKNFRIAYIHGGGFNSSYNGQLSFRYTFNTKQSLDINKNLNY